MNMQIDTLLTSATEVFRADSITAEILEALFHNEICILHIPNYCELTLCEKLATWFQHNDQLETYYYVKKEGDKVKKYDLGVERVGVAFNSTYARDVDAGDYEQYYAEALTRIRKLRLACAPYISPVDKLRLELDENWAAGANLANFEGRKMFVGIGRIMRPEKAYLAGLQPHCDSVPTHYAQNLLSQFSANIYLEVPPSGGEVEIWNIPPIPHQEVHKIKPGYDWRAELPASHLFKPNQGDLILFNTRRPHAIRGFETGIRINLQFFIGLNKDQRLSLWT